jgi:threonine/homoserine/homoserine lactone efflux protein
MVYYLIFGLSYSLACVAQPGPFQAFLFSQNVTNGWRKTIPLVFAPIISDIPVIALVLIILTNIPLEAISILQCVGGLFLLYLAFNAYKTWRTFYQNKKPDASTQQSFFKAIIVNILNPGPYLGWSLVMGPMLIKAWNENPINGIILLIVFYCSMIIYSLFMVILFAATANLGPKVNRILIAISVIAFLIFGFYQLVSGIKVFYNIG